MPDSRDRDRGSARDNNSRRSPDQRRRRRNPSDRSRPQDRGRDRDRNRNHNVRSLHGDTPREPRTARTPARGSTRDPEPARKSSRNSSRGGYVKVVPSGARNNNNRSLFWRTFFLMAVCGIVMFIPLAVQLYSLTIVNHEKYQRMATNQQTVDQTVTAGRGDIYDAKGNILAMSTTVYNLILSPRDLANSVDKKEYTDKNTKELDQEAYDVAVAEKQEQVYNDLLELIPDLDAEKLNTQIHAVKYAYREVRMKMSDEEHKPIQEYISENNTQSYLYFVPGSQRYYPSGSLAAQVLGFVNDEGGAIGIEAAFNSVLEGTDGRVMTTRTGRGTQMYDSYSEYIDAVDGNNVTLTLDSTIQSYVESALEEGIRAYDVRNGAFCLVMDPRTGAILAMASSPNFDPNDYSTILDSILQDNMAANEETLYQDLKKQNDEKPEGEEKLTDEEIRTQAHQKAVSDAINTQWRSKVLDSRYEPGSTFKAMVLSAALEEGVISEHDTFYCGGSVRVPGYPEPINCSKRSGHGTQDLATAVGNSCNPAFIEIGRRLGKEKFYDYFEAFGMTEQTGIELPGEASLSGAFWSREAMTNVDLAVASFGQRFEVTPLQMVSAFSAVVNGGNLVKPYLLDSITAKDGTVIQKTEPNYVRQVISHETSERASTILERVVSKGTGNNAYVAGYRIGGKTGSAETREKGRTIVSFVGFAPADDPRVVVLLAFDKPQESANPSYSTTGVYISGGYMAAPVTGPLIAKILDYMGVEKIYDNNEGAAANVSTPYVVGSTVEEASQALAKVGLKYRTVGTGDTVSRQIPAYRTQLPGDSSVILYLGDAEPESTGAVPNVVGLNYEDARSALEKSGFFMRATGVSTYYSQSTIAVSQGVEAGNEADIGTVVEVQFSNVVGDGPVQGPAYED